MQHKKKLKKMIEIRFNKDFKEGKRLMPIYY